MNTEILGIALQIILMIALSYPLGRYLAKVYKGEKTWSDFMAPIENLIYKVCGINPKEEMDWKVFLKSLLIVNLFWFIWGIVLLVSQGWLPLNPDGNPAQSPDQAFNTCISFLVNCNLQHYSGESGLTYFTQLFVIMFFQFITAATGMAAMAGVMKAMAAKTTQTIGNFWQLLVVSTTRILLPLSLIVGFILILQGTPMGFDGAMKLTTLEGVEQTVSQGPAAAIVPIKQLGTNGGGYFGTNSSHPLENPTYLTNMLECWAILLIPMAMIFALGFYLKRKKLAFVIYGVMLSAYLLGVVVNTYTEMNGNPRIDALGIAQTGGAMEGKEVRIGSGATALWSVTTTVTSNGSVNGMHDSTMPLSGMVQMLNMQINTWFGGVGVGFLNYYTFIIIAVFISGLMVGRTPEFLGKKVEAREMKIATLVALLHPFVILV
ncbi:MAG: potassium-transporting ATPase subunit KdpA, partial [Bacteroides sp.]